MSKLTQREKILIYVLILVLAVTAAWFLLKPALEESDDLDTRISEAVLNKSTPEQTIAMRPVYAENAEAAAARIEVLKGAFLPAMTNDDLDRYITGLLQKNGLVAESLLISESTDETVSLPLTRLHVQVTASGELEQYVALVEQLSRLEGIRIATTAVREGEEKTRLMPMTEEEIADQATNAANAKTKEKKAEGKTVDGVPTKEVSYMEYTIEIGFEVVEFDEELFAMMAG